MTVISRVSDANEHNGHKKKTRYECAGLQGGGGCYEENIFVRSIKGDRWGCRRIRVHGHGNNCVLISCSCHDEATRCDAG